MQIIVGKTEETLIRSYTCAAPSGINIALPFHGVSWPEKRQKHGLDVDAKHLENGCLCFDWLPLSGN